MYKAARKLARRMRRGFTLGELLVVVAIIGVLVAVAIPTFNYQLEKAREAVDITHLRQARSAGAAYFMDKTLPGEIQRKYYDVDTGELVGWMNNEYKQISASSYGKGTATVGGALSEVHGLKYGMDIDVRDCLIMVTADRDGNIFCGWVNPQYALRDNPFDFLAVENVNGKKVLHAVRSASSVTRKDIGLFVMDQNVRDAAGSADIDEINKVLKMYYKKTFTREDLYFSTIYSLDQNAAENRQYYVNTAFQDTFCDAEAATLATQFWAKITEISDPTYGIDGVSLATAKSDLPSGENGTIRPSSSTP